MAEVTHSPFLQALGYAIINSLWQFALLWLIYVSLHTFLRLSSHQKYTAGLVIQAAGFIWFSSTFTFYLHRFLQLEEIYFLQQKKFSFDFAGAQASTISERLFAGIMQTEIILPYLSVAYLIILFLLGFKWIRAYNITQTIRSKGLQKTEANWRVFVKRLSAQMGIKREVKIYLSELVKTPLTVGFFKPLILIPLASLNHLTTHQLEAVILHELAHIKRFDYLFNLFLALIDITLFFNPFAILISKQVKHERENCCDDWVLQYDYNAASYAKALLQIAICQSPSSLLALQATDNKHVLLKRIKRMIEKKERSFFNYRYQLIALFVMLTVACSLALLSSRHNINKAGVSALPRHVILKPIAEIINSPLYKPDFFIASDEEKIIKDKKLLTEKIPDKNFRFDTSFEGRITPVRDNKTSKQKDYRKQLSIKENPPVPDIPNEPPVPDTPDDPAVHEIANDLIADRLEKSIEILNTGSDKDLIPVAGVREHEIALAEEKLKELAIHVFERNKTLIDQKQVIAQIKAALAQLKTVKIQLNTVNERNGAGETKRNIERENQLRIKRLVTCNINELQRATKELQKQTEQAQKQSVRAFELDGDYHNNFFKTPGIIYRLPLHEKAHSFSFEFSAEPKVKVAVPRSLYNLKRGKKINKISSKEDIKKFKTEIPSPVIINRLAEKENTENFIIIRI